MWTLILAALIVREKVTREHTVLITRLHTSEVLTVRDVQCNFVETKTGSVRKASSPMYNRPVNITTWVAPMASEAVFTWRQIGLHEKNQVHLCTP